MQRPSRITRNTAAVVLETRPNFAEAEKHRATLQLEKGGLP